jgi:hypothetical protein
MTPLKEKFNLFTCGKIFIRLSHDILYLIND